MFVRKKKEVYIAFLVALLKGPMFVGKQNEGKHFMDVCMLLFIPRWWLFRDFQVVVQIFNIWLEMFPKGC
jgi:hypothetical protein